MRTPGFQDRDKLSQEGAAELGFEAGHGLPVSLACRSYFSRIHGVPELSPQEPSVAPEQAGLSQPPR